MEIGLKVLVYSFNLRIFLKKKSEENKAEPFRDTEERHL